MTPATLDLPRNPCSFRCNRQPRAALADPARHDYVVLVTAIERLLERCTRRDIDLHFAASRAAARALRVQLRFGSMPSLPAQLLSELCHEIAVHVDASVRQAALRCLRRAAARRRGA